jgi:hypothetical protein
VQPQPQFSCTKHIGSDRFPSVEQSVCSKVDLIPIADGTISFGLRKRSSRRLVAWLPESKHVIISDAIDISWQPLPTSMLLSKRFNDLLYVEAHHLNVGVTRATRFP